MALGILVLITALSISAVAIYYSIAGLVAIFAAAAIPIMIMGGVLEIGKLVTAVWLHKYWSQAKWWLKSYLATAVIVLMFITSMGIFGFLSKAHIEQTSASEESVAQVQQIESEIGRLNGVITRADEKIIKLESSGTGADANIQAQIDKEQERIDKAFDRIKPAIAQQNKIIEDARGTDANRTKPYEEQLTSITAEILRLETSAKDYEAKIENLDEGLKACDDLSLHVPLTEKTKNMLDYSKLKIMKNTAIVINTSRGGIINETDLDKAINDNIIFGAGLDVFEKEPVNINNPLLKNNKVLLSPHSATFTNECKSRMSLETTKNIIDFFENKIDKSMIIKI